MSNVLENRSIISTRPLSSDDRLISLLRDAGARLIFLPMIAIEKNSLDSEDMNRLMKVDQYDWLVFTSKNGVYYFFEHLEAARPGKFLPGNLKTAVVGTTTKNALLKFGIEPSLVSTGKTSVDLLNQLKEQIPVGENLNILLSLGTLAGTVLEDGLESIASTSRIIVYKTVPTRDIDNNIIQKIKEDQYDLILLTSPSAFHNLREYLDPFSVRELRFACIGPTTENALKEAGIEPVAVAETCTAKGLFKSVKNYFEINII